MALCQPARFALAALVFTITMVGSSMCMLAQADSNYVTSECILAIARFNGDCIPDTLMGRLDRQFQYVPTSIRWGGWDTLHTPPCPPDIYHHRPRYPFSTFEYPVWPNFSASSAIEKMDADSLKDIVFYMWGHYVDSTGVRDSGRAVILFGQASLDTLSTINISHVVGFQSYPCFAMELKPGVGLSDPAVRDATGVTSYVVNRVARPIIIGPLKQEESASVQDPWSVQLYPNPAVTSTQMEGRLIPAGEYSVEVISVNGSIEREQNVSVSETGELFRVIDLRDLASGYYLVRLHSKGKLFGTYPIIVRK